MKQDKAWYGIGTPEEVIAGSKDNCSDNDYDLNSVIDFFNSATAVIKAKREHLEVIDETRSSKTAIKTPKVVVTTIRANTQLGLEVGAWAELGNRFGKFGVVGFVW